MKAGNSKRWLGRSLFAAVLVTGAVAMRGEARAEREFGDEYHFEKAGSPVQDKLDSLVGKKMPPLQVSGWINGTVPPKAMAGKVVLVDIWATWCGPCRASIPHNNELKEKYKGDLVIVGVCSSAQGQDKLAAVVKSDKIAYPVCKDPGQATAKAYKIGFYPTYVAVDKKGIVRAAGLRPDKVEAVLEVLLKEEGPSTQPSAGE